MATVESVIVFRSSAPNDSRVVFMSRTPSVRTGDSFGLLKIPSGLQCKPNCAKAGAVLPVCFVKGAALRENT